MLRANGKRNTRGTNSRIQKRKMSIPYKQELNHLGAHILRNFSTYSQILSVISSSRSQVYSLEREIRVLWTSLMVQWVKNPPTMQETQVLSLGQEDPLEKEMATHSSILAWEIPWTEEPGGLQSKGLQRVRHDWVPKNRSLGFCF